MKIGKLGRRYLYVIWSDRELDAEKLKGLSSGEVHLRKRPMRHGKKIPEALGLPRYTTNDPRD